MVAVALTATPAAGAAVVRTTLEPQTALFGQPVTAEVAVVAGEGEDPASLRIDADVRPFRRLADETVRDGRLVVRRLRIACVERRVPPGRRGEAGPPARRARGRSRRRRHASPVAAAARRASRPTRKPPRESPSGAWTPGRRR